MEYRQLLQQYWGYNDFRGIQKDIIHSIGEGRDTLGLMPTGGGKSITFQVPALAKEGVCIVVTPLIALMKDQVDHLLQRGIKAAAIYSGMTRQEIIKTLENAVFGGLKLLYVSPERLFSELFLSKFRHMHVSFITVDEAHCISQWGYDFRPSYLHIAELRKLKPEVPILALTATATTDVVDDIQERLNFRAKNVFRMSFQRENLCYVVRIASDKEAELIHILQAVQGSAIVYVRSRKRTKEIAQLLKDNAFGMGIDKPDVRVVIHMDSPDSLEAYFQEAGRAGRDGKKAYAVLLYNSADARKLHKRVGDNFPEKDEIRKVYDSLAYYYQIGVGSGGGHTFSFNIAEFCSAYHLSLTLTDASLRIIERLGYILYENDPNNSARLMFLLSRNQLYLLDNLSQREDLVIDALMRLYGGLFNDYVYIDEQLIAQRTGLTPQQLYLILKNLNARHILHFIPQRKMPYINFLRSRVDGEQLVIGKAVYEDRKKEFEKRIQAVIAYAENDKICRSRQLLRYFGETDSEDCGRCDVCLDRGQKSASEQKMEACRQAILDFLSDHQRHHLTDLDTLQLPERHLDEALEYLVHEELIQLEGSYLWVE